MARHRTRYDFALQSNKQTITYLIMSLIRYISPELNPIGSLGNLRDHFGRLFDLTFPTRTAESFGDWTPSLDAREDQDKYVVAVEIPGIKKEDMK